MLKETNARAASEAIKVLTGGMVFAGIYVVVAVMDLVVLVDRIAAFAAVEEAFVIACLALGRVICAPASRAWIVRGCTAIDCTFFGTASPVTTIVAGISADSGVWIFYSIVAFRFVVRLLASLAWKLLFIETMIEWSFICCVVLCFGTFYAVRRIRTVYPDAFRDFEPARVEPTTSQ